MFDSAGNILLIEDDDEVASMIEDFVRHRLRANVTRVTTADEALKAMDTGHKDVVLADLNLPDACDLRLVRQIRESDDCEVVLMTGQPTLGRAMEAIRLGVREMFAKPFDLHRLGETLERAIADHRQRHRDKLRYDRLRRVSSHIIRERRVLKERVNLVCRDLVGAYRRLAEKVIDHRGAPN